MISLQSEKVVYSRTADESTTLHSSSSRKQGSPHIIASVYYTTFSAMRVVMKRAVWRHTIEATSASKSALSKSVWNREGPRSFINVLAPATCLVHCWTEEKSSNCESCKHSGLVVNQRP